MSNTYKCMYFWPYSTIAADLSTERSCCVTVSHLSYHIPRVLREFRFADWERHVQFKICAFWHGTLSCWLGSWFHAVWHQILIQPSECHSRNQAFSYHVTFCIFYFNCPVLGSPVYKTYKPVGLASSQERLFIFTNIFL